MSEIGVKEDSGKIEPSLVPYDAEEEVVRVLVWGAYERPRKDGSKGYGANNWEHVPDARKRYYDAARRHLNKWFWKRERNDDESGLHHLAHAICCCLFLLALDLRGKLDEPK